MQPIFQNGSHLFQSGVTSICLPVVATHSQPMCGRTRTGWHGRQLFPSPARLKDIRARCGFGGGVASNGYIRAGLLVALLAFATACDDDRDGRASEEESPSAPATSTSTDETLPTASPSEKGVRVAVPSHCGVLSLIVRGRLWLADPPLGDHNPPPGWDENQTVGVLLKTGPGRAVFTGDGGQRASFQRAPRGAADPNAGCE
jgi:hypothetical protein